MPNVILRVATLKGANLQNCNLRGAILAGADLEVCLTLASCFLYSIVYLFDNNDNNILSVCCDEVLQIYYLFF